LPRRALPRSASSLVGCVVGPFLGPSIIIKRERGEHGPAVHGHRMRGG
jgi:hypothetical protein